MKKYLTGLCLAIWHLLMPNSALAQKPIQQPEISTIPDNLLIIRLHLVLKQIG
ncbi:hypothetical protein [Kingella negevensis]|uniref:hypothetical protein n=1 Tax=Kingella negevensis TaxID=1522312 RepID=UPI0025513AB1|nr:hypothetical protein [Kingella negevensis]MDK4692058.1 hypothetical protein [Kingella negevensis]MDK4708222.1 hypothetical protein [Kingella negevensis]